MSEADFLAWQAEAAGAAFRDALGDLKARLRAAADLRSWAERHPWAAVGTAAAAGLAAASALPAIARGAARRQRARARTRRRAEVLTPAAGPPVPHGELGAFLATLLAPAIDHLRSALASAFLSTMRVFARSSANGHRPTKAADVSNGEAGN